MPASADPRWPLAPIRAFFSGVHGRYQLPARGHPSAGRVSAPTTGGRRGFLGDQMPGMGHLPGHSPSRAGAPSRPHRSAPGPGREAPGGHRGRAPGERPRRAGRGARGARRCGPRAGRRADPGGGGGGGGGRGAPCSASPHRLPAPAPPSGSAPARLLPAPPARSPRLLARSRAPHADVTLHAAAILRASRVEPAGAASAAGVPTTTPRRRRPQRLERGRPVARPRRRRSRRPQAPQALRGRPGLQPAAPGPRRG